LFATSVSSSVGLHVLESACAASLARAHFPSLKWLASAASLREVRESVNPRTPMSGSSKLRRMQAKIKEKREVAKGTLMVTFDLLGEQVDFVAGQYFWVELLDPPYDDEKGPRRHISVCTSPNDHGVLGLCTRLRDTAFKRSLAELPVGADVDVEQPKGNFLLPTETDKPFVFVAGGIGITVFRSMLLYITEEGLPHRVTLVYSNRDRESTAFLDEMQELAERNPSIRLVLTMTEDEGWEGEKRFIDADMLRDHLDGDLADYRYLVAGPPPMAEAVVEKLQGAGIPEDQIESDRFSGY
jgi:NAD(P)H-flavin reductase